jgi:hypothetical protein
MNASRTLLLALTVCVSCISPAGAEEALPPIPLIQRVLPPEGIEIPAEVRQRLETRIQQTKDRLREPLQKVNGNDIEVRRWWRTRVADVQVFVKAVELALLHGEFYNIKDFEKADWALDETNRRLDALERNAAPWEKATGLVVRGYRSSVDGSAQPYGLVIPEGHDFGKACPLYVWLHGRGDKSTDLHFLFERANKVGQIAPPGAIVVHPFGRHCVGYKHAGEVDVLEVIEEVKEAFRVDADRIVLIGFSMGGAGAWHLGAHWASDFVAVSPGAGFAETARYQKLAPAEFPPAYEQRLWGMYDAPNYVRNLFNSTVIAYSGENDKQIQAARVMEEAFAAEGRKLTHLIGPGVEHKYEPKTLEELLRRLDAAVVAGRNKVPQAIHLQTRTLAYHVMRWVTVEGLEEHWQDSRVDAEIVGDRRIKVATKNVTALRLMPWDNMPGVTIDIDGQIVKLGDGSTGNLHREGPLWTTGTLEDQRSSIRKTKFCKGPIDDCFMHDFVIVTPTGMSRNPRFQQWMEFELAHFRDRWSKLMRATLCEVRDVDFPLDRLRSTGCVLWGDADSNSVIRKVQEHLPVRFQNGRWRFGDSEFDGNLYVPALIFPYCYVDPETSVRFQPQYIVLNSGLTFREGHDRTNSLQNPKLPDWAIIDITQAPDAFAPGRIHDAGFFDEKWQLKSQPKGP